MRSGLALAALVSFAGAVAHADALDAAMRAAIARDGVPGVALAIVRRGRIVKVGAYGVADVGWKARVTPDTRFEIASMSKMFVGAAVRILVDAGKLGLEDPVDKHLPGLPAAWRGMKVRHLLTMSAGLPEDWGTPLIPYAAEVTTAYDDASMLKAFGTLPPAAPIGREFHYSSPSYAMLGMIVARVAGSSLDAFTRARIFGPAGMANTSFIDHSAVAGEEAQGYRREGGVLKKGWRLAAYLHARADVGISSTAHDLAKWAIALDAGAVVKDPARLFEPTRSDAGHALDYAYGWRQDLLFGHPRQLHDGQFRTGFRSLIQRLPADGVTVVVLANCDCAPVDRYAYLAARSAIRDLPDLERPRPDPDPTRTAALVAALQGVARGKLDERVFTPDAFEPLTTAEAGGFLREAKSYRVAAAGRLSAPITMHGHRLVEHETLVIGGDGGLVITFYRDESGRVAYAAPL